jgi:hydrogenase maturation protein HypF
VSLLSDFTQEDLSIAELARSVWPDVDPNEIASVQQIMSNATFSLLTTSVGRLFDGVAALVLGIARVEFDGQAAMLLEAAADASVDGQYRLPVLDGERLILDWRPLVADVLMDRANCAPPGAIAMRFHRALAAGISEIWKRRCDLPLVLSGGVFQNRLLTETIVDLFPGSPQQLGLPGMIPPNDGGLAAGQLAIAIARTIV